MTDPGPRPPGRPRRAARPRAAPAARRQRSRTSAAGGRVLERRGEGTDRMRASGAATSRSGQPAGPSSRPIATAAGRWVALDRSLDRHARVQGAQRADARWRRPGASVSISQASSPSRQTTPELDTPASRPASASKPRRWRGWSARMSSTARALRRIVARAGSATTSRTVSRAATAVVGALARARARAGRAARSTASPTIATASGRAMRARQRPRGIDDHRRAGSTVSGSIGFARARARSGGAGPVVFPVSPTVPSSCRPRPGRPCGPRARARDGRSRVSTLAPWSIIDHDRAVGHAAGEDHPPRRHRQDRRADRRRDVEPVVEVRVARALVAERRLAGERRRAEALA